MKASRYIALLLLICFSGFLGHNLVPHHHHTEAFLNPISTDCPIQHEDHHSFDQGTESDKQHSEDHPAHCHAFNDVVFEKYHIQALKPVPGHALVMTVSHTDLVPDTPAKHEFYRHNGLKFPLKSIELYGSRDLRGPPSAA